MKTLGFGRSKSQSLSELLLRFKTYENLRFWEIEAVLPLCFQTYENLTLWEIEEPKRLTVSLLCFKTYEHLRFWEIEELKSLTVLLLCPKPMKTFGFGRSKS